MRLFWCMALASLLATGAARADDSSAALGAGGVTFAKSANIRMAAEDLRISPEKITVRFEFVNDGARDIDTVVAFPLPDVDTTEFWFSPLGAVTDDPVNFVNFKVRVNGRPVAFEAEQRAIYKGRDVTATVRAAGIPVNIVMGGRFNTLEKLAPAGKKLLGAAGIAELEEQNAFPKWIIRTRFHWKQRFPAGKTVVIEHSYQPVTGGAFFTKYEMAARGKDDYWKQHFCMDPPTLSRIHKMLAAAAVRQAQGAQDAVGDMLQIFTTEYILSTGNNWKGPIGRFHLTLDKLKPANTLSLCWAGDLKKTGPTTFEFARMNYAPDRDVRMVVLH